MLFHRLNPFLIFFLSALVPVPGQVVNALTDAEKQEGWLLMFDGKTLNVDKTAQNGWHSFKRDTIKDYAWAVKDSAIYLRGQGAGALLAPNIFTFQNFDISIDWKLPDSGNSGIFLRYLETQDNESIRTGPETQICGRENKDYKDGLATTSPGACYDMYPPSQEWIKPADQYNTLRIIMYEKKVAHFGNGLKLLEYTIGDSDWTARYATSKYQFFPLYGEIHPGKLFLQDHASHVWYRNIKIRPLDSDPWKDPGFIWPDDVRIPARRSSMRRISVRSAADGRLSLSSDAGGDWDLSLFDPMGRRRGAFSGMGTRILGAAPIAAGYYFLSGSLDGNRTRAALPLPGR